MTLACTYYFEAIQATVKLLTVINKVALINLH